ncbi:MAG: SAV_6107 family HEPN domain-containing protein [Mycobacteriales bacterium]
MTTSMRRLGPSRVPGQVVPSALGLLDQARRGLQEAAELSVPAERYATAHLAALRSAAAVLAARTRPVDSRLRRRRPTSAWVLLVEVAPELGEWAAFFAAGAAKRAAAEAGVTRAVTAREADDLVRDAATFLALAETTLGLVPSLPLGAPRAG